MGPRKLSAISHHSILYLPKMDSSQRPFAFLYLQSPHRPFLFSSPIVLSSSLPEPDKSHISYFGSVSRTLRNTVSGSFTFTMLSCFPWSHRSPDPFSTSQKPVTEMCFSMLVWCAHQNTQTAMHLGFQASKTIQVLPQDNEVNGTSTYTTKSHSLYQTSLSSPFKILMILSNTFKLAPLLSPSLRYSVKQHIKPEYIVYTFPMWSSTYGWLHDQWNRRQTEI